MPFERGNWMRGVTAGVLALSLVSLGACSTTKAPKSQSGGGFSLFHPLGGGKSKGPQAPSDAPAIGVNGYLWRSTLDTLSFMPLVSADPYGGVVITDWAVENLRALKRPAMRRPLASTAICGARPWTPCPSCPWCRQTPMVGW